MAANANFMVKVTDAKLMDVQKALKGAGYYAGSVDKRPLNRRALRSGAL